MLVMYVIGTLRNTPRMGHYVIISCEGSNESGFNRKAIDLKEMLGIVLVHCPVIITHVLKS